MDGIIIIDKPKNITSRDVVNHVCKRLNTKKIGHTATLDPIATGVLVLCVGKATKLVELLTCEDKEYVATVKLGILTDTLDTEGKVIEEKKVFLDKEELTKVLNSFIGEYDQEVPIYSAVKINGKKLYEYAREKRKLELPKRKVAIKSIKLLELNDDSYKFKVVVSKGTYIRSLCEKIAEDLNTVGYMKELQRVQVGEFNIGQAVGIVEVRKNPTLIEEKIISIEKYFEEKRKNKIITKRIKNVFEWYANKKRL